MRENYERLIEGQTLMDAKIIFMLPLASRSCTINAQSADLSFHGGLRVAFKSIKNSSPLSRPFLFQWSPDARLMRLIFHHPFMSFSLTLFTYIFLPWVHRPSNRTALALKRGNCLCSVLWQENVTVHTCTPLKSYIWFELFSKINDNRIITLTIYKQNPDVWPCDKSKKLSPLT